MAVSNITPGSAANMEASARPAEPASSPAGACSSQQPGALPRDRRTGSFLSLGLRSRPTARVWGVSQTTATLPPWPRGSCLMTEGWNCFDRSSFLVPLDHPFHGIIFPIQPRSSPHRSEPPDDPRQPPLRAPRAPDRRTSFRPGYRAGGSQGRSTLRRQVRGPDLPWDGDRRGQGDQGRRGGPDGPIGCDGHRPRRRHPLPGLHRRPYPPDSRAVGGF